MLAVMKIVRTAATKTQPSSEATLLRARRLANRTIFTIKLQHRRLRTDEPEDEIFIFRWLADIEFLILSLRRLRMMAQLAARHTAAPGPMQDAIADFDRALPFLRKMRNVGEHLDTYAIDDARRHHADVGRKQLEVSMWDGRVFTWLGHELDVDIAVEAAGQLFVAIKAASAEAARAPKTLDFTTSAGTVRYVLPDPPPTAEQVAEAKSALLDLVRTLARQAAREDF